MLSANDLKVLDCALFIAAGEYDKCAKTCENGDNTPLKQAFERQAAEARELRERLERVS